MSDSPTAFSSALDSAIERRGLPLARIRALLRRQGHDVSVSALSYWRRGIVHPRRAASLLAIEALEGVLDLPRGGLTSALDPRIVPQIDGEPSLEGMVEELGLSWDDGLLRTSILDVVDIADGGGVKRVRKREAVVARRDGIDRFPVSVWATSMPTWLALKASGSCRIGRQVRSADALVSEILLPHTLGSGDRWVTEYVEEWNEPEVIDDCGWGRCLLTATGFLQILVRFPEGRGPRTAEVVFTDPSGQEEVRPVENVSDPLGVHVRDPGPGTIDLTWTY